MLISLLVVVPTLNSFSLLPRLVSSLRAQTFTGWRVLFVDGPSHFEHREWLDHLCFCDDRFSWIAQSFSRPGIFGAMNQGIEFAHTCSLPPDYLLFWGSDDWAASPIVLAQAFSSLTRASLCEDLPDLIVCRGRYVDQASSALTRSTAFRQSGFLTSASYRRALFFGSTPPHQATFFGSGALKYLDHYSDDFLLSADLDYFLQLRHRPALFIQCLDLELVHMSSGGISGVQTQRRLSEVCNAYRRGFGLIWWVPFLLRYLRRLLSILPSWA